MTASSNIFASSIIRHRVKTHIILAIRWYSFYLIKETLSNTNWEAIFKNSTPGEAVKDFTDIVLSTMSQFIPNKIITINERDTPLFTKSIENKIKSKHRAYHKFLSRGRRPEEKEHINRLRNETNRLIVNAKDDYFYNLGQKLTDPSLGPQSYWTVLNKILNKKKCTNIPPLLINDIFV